MDRDAEVDTWRRHFSIYKTTTNKMVRKSSIKWNI
jgi:hypothetical protein